MIIFFKNNAVAFQKSFAIIVTKKKKLNETRSYRTLRHRQDYDLLL